MHTRSSEVFFFRTRTGFANQSVWTTSRMNLAVVSLRISFPTALHLSIRSRRRPCFTGLASLLTFKECSASFLGTPGMSSDGDQAKISQFSWRNLTSSPSYLSPRPAPMMASFVGSSSESLIFLVSSFGLKLESTLEDGFSVADISLGLIVFLRSSSSSLEISSSAWTALAASHSFAFLSLP